MRNQKGLTVIEMLIWIAIFGIIASIAIPAFQSIQERNQGLADFQVYFGVALPAGDLDDKQKEALKSYVKNRLDEYADRSKGSNDALEALLTQPPAKDAAEAQTRLDAVTKADTDSKSSLADYQRAKYAAKLRGLE